MLDIQLKPHQARQAADFNIFCRATSFKPSAEHKLVINLLEPATPRPTTTQQEAEQNFD